MGVHSMELIPDVKLITLKIHIDDRGSFAETFSLKEYCEVLGIEGGFVQDNISWSHKGVLRGLHFQEDPYAQGKLVMVMHGSVYDVAVDLRPRSETFGKYVAVELSATSLQQFWIPPGFAHGFLTLEDNTIFMYKCTEYYHPEADAGVLWKDRYLDIDWPDLDVSFILSDKDQHQPTLYDITHR